MKKKFAIILIIILLIILGVTIIIGLNQEKEDLTETEQTTTKKVETPTQQLSNSEIIDILKIYQIEGTELIVTEELDKIKTIERKNNSTGEVDMVFKFDIKTNDFTIDSIRPQSQVGGGSGEE